MLHRYYTQNAFLSIYRRLRAKYVTKHKQNPPSAVPGGLFDAYPRSVSGAEDAEGIRYPIEHRAGAKDDAQVRQHLQLP